MRRLRLDTAARTAAAADVGGALECDSVSRATAVAVALRGPGPPWAHRRASSASSRTVNSYSSVTVVAAQPGFAQTPTAATITSARSGAASLALVARQQYYHGAATNAGPGRVESDVVTAAHALDMEARIATLSGGLARAAANLAAAYAELATLSLEEEAAAAAAAASAAAAAAPVAQPGPQPLLVDDDTSIENHYHNDTATRIGSGTHGLGMPLRQQRRLPPSSPMTAAMAAAAAFTVVPYYAPARDGHLGPTVTDSYYVVAPRAPGGSRYRSSSGRSSNSDTRALSESGGTFASATLSVVSMSESSTAGFQGQTLGGQATHTVRRPRSAQRATAAPGPAYSSTDRARGRRLGRAASLTTARGHGGGVRAATMRRSRSVEYVVRRPGGSPAVKGDMESWGRDSARLWGPALRAGPGAAATVPAGGVAWMGRHCSMAWRTSGAAVHVPHGAGAGSRRWQRGHVSDSRIAAAGARPREYLRSIEGEVRGSVCSV